MLIIRVVQGAAVDIVSLAQKKNEDKEIERNVRPPYIVRTLLEKERYKRSVSIGR